MVAYELIEKNDDKLIYRYFPADERDKKPGTVIVDRLSKKIEVTEIAEMDVENYITPEELNEMIDAINEMRKERGCMDFDEHVETGETSIYFADHVVFDLRDRLKNGEIPEKGMPMWY